MAAKEHKHASQFMTIETTLTADQLTECATVAIEGLKSTSVGINGVTAGQKVLVAAAGPAAVMFIVKNAVGSTIMRFSLTLDETAEVTRGRSRIDDYQMSRQTAFFVPVTPRTMDGFHMYKGWAAELVRTVKARDPQARTTSTMTP